MSQTIRYTDLTGLTLYVKPLPLSATPSWGDDVVAATEVVVSSEPQGVYQATVGDTGQYAWFVQAGASPAATDGPVVALTDVGKTGLILLKEAV